MKLADEGNDTYKPEGRLLETSTVEGDMSTMGTQAASSESGEDVLNLETTPYPTMSESPDLLDEDFMSTLSPDVSTWVSTSGADTEDLDRQTSTTIPQEVDYDRATSTGSCENESQLHRLGLEDHMCICDVYNFGPTCSEGNVSEFTIHNLIDLKYVYGFLDFVVTSLCTAERGTLCIY